MSQREVVSRFFTGFDVTVVRTSWSGRRKHQMPEHSVWFNHDLELVNLGILTLPERPKWKDFTFETALTLKLDDLEGWCGVQFEDGGMPMYLIDGTVMNRYHTSN